MSMTNQKKPSETGVSEAEVIEALRPIQDPDLHRSIVDLGFVKNLKIEGARVAFDLELTTPACPMKDMLKSACERAALAIAGVESVAVNLTARTRGAAPDKREILQGVKNIVAIASGKGGVGKSTTAVNLALALREAGARVGLLDADIYGPSIPMMIPADIPPGPAPDERMQPARGAGLSLMSMGYFMQEGQAAILRGPMVSGYTSQFLTRVDWGELDYLIVDYPPGTGDIQLTLSQQAPLTGAVIVTTPQEIALADVRRAIRMFQATGVPVLGVCETMSYFICDGCGKRHDIFPGNGGRRTAEKAGVPFLGAAPIDPAVAHGGDTGKPILLAQPDSPVAAAYREIASALAARLATLHLMREQTEENA